MWANTRHMLRGIFTRLASLKFNIMTGSLRHQMKKYAYKFKWIGS